MIRAGSTRGTSLQAQIAQVKAHCTSRLLSKAEHRLTVLAVQQFIGKETVQLDVSAMTLRPVNTAVSSTSKLRKTPIARFHGLKKKEKKERRTKVKAEKGRELLKPPNSSKLTLDNTLSAGH